MALTKIPGSLIEASGNLTITDLTVTGDLSITGDLNSYNVTDLDVVDQTITLGAGQTEALSGGSGIIIDGSSASILWDETNDVFNINKGLTALGNVGIGTTSPQKALNVFADNTAPVRFERNTSDGQIIQLYKDGTTVGSIGTASSGNIFYQGGGSKAGLEFGSTAIIPFNNGVRADATNDLGGSSNRFKDLYLSGTARSNEVSINGTTVINSSRALTNITSADFSNTIEVYDSDYAIVDNGSTGWSYSPQESGSASIRYFLLFNYDNNASYPYLTNRTPSGSVRIFSGTAAGGGDNEKIRVNGGDGTTDVTFSNSQLNIGDVISDDSDFLSGTQRIVSDGYIATQAIYNYGETGASPAAIVFGNGSTYGLDQISLITSGVTALYIDSSSNISFSGKITSTVEAAAADDTFKSGTFFNVGENPINNPWHTCTQVNSSGAAGGTANCGDCVDTTGTIAGCSQGTGSAYNWYSAKRYCELAGMRLCTAAEVRAGAGAGSGCQHNSRGQWTSTKGTTDSTKYFIVQGDGTGSSATAEQENYPYNTTITGFTINEIAIRCCQQNSWS